MKSTMLEKIDKKRKELEVVKTKLKNDFVGLDKIIDEVISNLEVWYIMPEIITKPVIINLWGMTGVGKTDLVRKLVAYLGFADAFVEMQMGNKDESYRSNNIKNILMTSSIEENQPGIILFDEIQRFRSKTPMGENIDNGKYQDVWMLLSDGCFNSCHSKKADLMNLLMEELYNKDWHYNGEGDDGDDEWGDSMVEINEYQQKQKNPKRTFYNNSYGAISLKQELRLPDEISEIMKWDTETKIKKIEKSLKSEDVYESINYSKILIFISGNLDEAYEMSGNVADVDNDADVLHKHSLNINFIDIKTSLNQLFYPEQISRFGNTHIIYPSFSRQNYKDIIKKRVNEIIKQIKNKTKLQLVLDDSVFTSIYNNGVFPSQGVRPVISTISSIFESKLPMFIMKAIENNQQTIKLKIKDNALYSTIGKQEYSVDVVCNVEDVKNNIKSDIKIMIAVHESGHALLYALKRKTSPAHINANRAQLGGFVYPHKSTGSRRQMLDQIEIYLAGYIAEEIIFGPQHRTSGCSSDIFEATQIAGSYIRSYGMASSISYITSEDKAENGEYNYDTVSTNQQIEDLLKTAEESVRHIIEQYQNVIITLSDYLFENEQMNAEQFCEIIKPYIDDVQIVDPKEILTHEYVKIYERYKNELKKLKYEKL